MTRSYDNITGLPPSGMAVFEVRMLYIWGSTINVMDLRLSLIQFLSFVTVRSRENSYLIIMKGDRKRKKAWFQKGRDAYNKGQPRCASSYTSQETSVESSQYVRLTKDVFESVAEPSHDGKMVFARDADGKMLDLKLLRPRPAPPTHLETLCEAATTESTSSTYKVMLPHKVEKLWQISTQEHLENYPDCRGHLKFDESGERKVGLCWQERLKCSDCDYVSSREKLYEELDSGKRGRKAAVPNVAVQVGLTHTGIGNTGLRSLLNAAHIAAPALSTLQSTSNDVSDKLIATNKEDMKRRRQNIKEINKIKGLPADAGIRVEGDARYNNPLYTAAGNTPFQPATQVTYTICENVTPKKQILSVATHNKLCQTGARHAGKSGTDRHCPNPHPGYCSATIAQEQSIGDEYQWATECVKDLLNDGITVKYYTSDCDSRASAAAADLYLQEGVSTESPPIHLKDPQHLARGQRRKVITTKFSARMFPGRTAVDRSKMKTRFADDLSDRCSAEHKAIHAHFEGDIVKVKRAISYTGDAIIECYKGHHQLCKKHSFVCDGSLTGKWNATFLPENCDITPTRKDESLLRECIDYRIGQKTVTDTMFLTNTQKSEGVNRAFSLRNPKNTTYSRNFSGRIHSAVHQMNNGPGQSLSLQLQAVGAPITPGSRIARQLKQKQKRHAYIKNYLRSKYARLRRCKLRIYKYKLYDMQSKKKSSVVHYKKGLIDNTKDNSIKTVKPATRGQAITDHSYCKSHR